MIKNIILVAVSVFVISLTISAPRAAAQEEGGETPPAVESVSTTAQEVQDEKQSSLVVSATRYETPQNLVSSDITVITKEDIAHLPVHDVADVLNYITGVSVDRGGGPGTPSFLSIQGSNYNHVKVMVDNIPIENLVSGFPDTSFLNLNNVDRIEVLKGSASSVWGSSIGGVINIVTKKPTDTISAEGIISVGENSTHHLQATLSGTSGVGYYLSAKKFETDGFRENQRANNNNFYAKITGEISPTFKLEGSYEYVDIDREDSGFSIDLTNFFGKPEKVKENTIDRRARLLLDYFPAETVDVILDGYYRAMDTSLDGTDEKAAVDNEETYGGGIRSVWRHSSNGTFSAGAEGSHGKITENYFYLFGSDVTPSVEKRDIYANELYSINNLTINIGVRHDDDSIYGSETSPSAGLVYRAGDTIFRVNAVRGFTPPPAPLKNYADPNIGLHAERAWTYQGGVEHDFRLLNAKATLYRSDIRDLVNWNDSGYAWNVDKVKKEGVEIDLKTRELHGLTLSYGYAFNDVRNEKTDEIIKGQVRVTHNIGADYRGPYETRLNLQGHYMYWNKDKAKDQNFLWDTKFSKYFTNWKSAIGELFVSVHNITDADQYWNWKYPNPGRWVEAGVSLSTF